MYVSGNSFMLRQTPLYAYMRVSQVRTKGLDNRIILHVRDIVGSRIETQLGLRFYCCVSGLYVLICKGSRNGLPQQSSELRFFRNGKLMTPTVKVQFLRSARQTVI